MMSTGELITLVLSASGLTGLATLGAAKYLFNRFMDIQVQKAIGKYEAALRDKTEALKSDLSIYAHEQTIGLTRLEELRATAIQEIYALVIAWQELFLDITQPNLPKRGSDEVKLQQLVNWSQNLVHVAEKLSIKLRDSALFFDEQSYNVVMVFGKLTIQLSTDFYDATFGAWDKKKDPDYAVLFKSFDVERAKLREAATGEYDKASKTLIIEFRKLMKAERVQPLKA